MANDSAFRFRIRLSAAVAALVLTVGCGGMRVPTESLTSSELDRIAAAVDATALDINALRGTGNGLFSSEDRKTPFAFAVVYDSADWLRADVRPSSPAVPSGFAGQLLIEHGCASLLFPSSLVMVTGCLDVVPFADPALLMFGAIRSDDILGLEDPVSVVDGNTMRLKGRCGGATIDLVLDRQTHRLSGLEVQSDDDDWISIEYDGRGWKNSLPLPRTTIIRFGRKGRTQARLRFEFERLRAIDSVDRTALDLVVPPGTARSGWEDLDLWR